MGPRLKDKVALIAGAGSVAPGWSNGKATSVLFAREGAKVFAADLIPEAAEDTAAAIRNEGNACTPFAADVAKAVDVKAMVAACLDAYGRIDVLFNNVGLQALGGPEEVSEEDWDRLMTVNVKAMYLTCREVLPVMARQGGGAIVNNSSLAGRRFLYPSVAYAASKGAVNQLTRNIAVQYAPHNVRVNAILPGLMATPRITARLRGAHGDDAYEEELRARDRLVPMGRMGDAWDVAHAVLFLASDEARYVTGIELLVDGGLAASAIGRPWG